MGRASKLRQEKAGASKGFGKSNSLEIGSNIKIITVFEYAKENYKIYGRGVVAYPGDGYEPTYIHKGSEHYNPKDEAMLQKYTPETEIVFTYPVGGLRINAPWVTTIEKKYSKAAKLRIGVQILP